MMSVILGPVPCQGCGELVVYSIDGERHLGWWHEATGFRCPAIEAPAGRHRDRALRLTEKALRLIGLHP